MEIQVGDHVRIAEGGEGCAAQIHNGMAYVEITTGGTAYLVRAIVTGLIKVESKTEPDAPLPPT